ncbi:MAG: ankyrin repeat domain-containing protein, partial [Holosporaceae bacterium]|nr:ankyrin repeat domain-containing protein [Holosporaceae bacterium]
ALLEKEGIDVNVADHKEGLTPLHLAAEGGHIAVVNVLLDKRADANAVDCYKRMPLHYAAGRGHIAVVNALLANALLEKGADANAVDHEDNYMPSYSVDAADHNMRTPLHYAAAGGHLEVVNALLAKKLEVVNAQLAKEFEKIKALCVEEAKGEDVDDEVVKARYAYEAEVEDFDDSVNYMLRDFVSIPDDKYCTPLHYAAENGSVAVVNVLLDRGADVNGKDYRAFFQKASCTPLHLAVENGHLEVVNVLLAKEADVNDVDYEGRTPLYDAAKNGHVDVVKALLEAGADASKAITRYNKTPLDEAAETFLFKKKYSPQEIKSLAEKFLAIYDAITESPNEGKQLINHEDTVNKALSEAKKLVKQSPPQKTAQPKADK